MAATELVGDEIRPTLNLSADQIAALEAEKASLTGVARGRLKSDAKKLPGEGSALDEDRLVTTSLRDRLTAESTERGEPGKPVQQQSMPVATAPVVAAQRAKITVDPMRLAELAGRAQQLETEEEEVRAMYETATTAAREARAQLDAYLREHGLA